MRCYCCGNFGFEFSGIADFLTFANPTFSDDFWLDFHRYYYIISQLFQKVNNILTDRIDFFGNLLENKVKFEERKLCRLMNKKIR